MPDPIYILLVEDNADHAAIVHDVLTSQDGGCEVHIVPTLREAKAALDSHTADIVLADWMLPDGEGLSLLDTMDSSSSPPLVLMTSQGNEEVAVEAMRRGALDYVVKTPESLRGMRHTVDRAIRAWMLDRARVEAEKGLQFQSLVLDQISDTVVMTDLDGTVIYTNAAFKRLSGATSKGTVGRHVDVVGGFFSTETSASEIMRKTLEEGSWRGNASTKSPNATLPRHLDLRTNLIHDANGRPIGCCGVSTDITGQRQAEMHVRALQNELDSIVRAVPDTIYRLDRAGRFTFVSESIRRFGYHPVQLTGLRLLDLIRPEDRETLADIVSEPFDDPDETRVLETALAKPDGTAVPVEIRSRPLYALAMPDTPPPDGNEQTVFVGTQGLARDITQRKQAEEDIHLLTRELIRAQESERLRISLDLHDNVAQELAAARIACDTANFADDAVSPTVRKSIEKVSQLLQTAITSIRNLSQDLRPPGLDELGLVKTLSQYCQEFAFATGIAVDFQATGIDDTKLTHETRIHVYRLVQECLTNTRKHSRADLVQVRLIASSPDIIVRIRDDGKGFPVSDTDGFAPDKTHMGLKGMRERVNLLGGRFEITSQPGQGTDVRMEIPIQGDVYA